MIDAQPEEIEAALYGGKMGAEYLASIDKTDLALLTGEEVQQLLLCICGGYEQKKRA